MHGIKENDVVALLVDLPEQGLKHGDLGTIIEVFSETAHHPAGFTLEFVDKKGEVYKQDTIKLLDVIALIKDLPEQDLRRGEVDTVVDKWAGGVFEVDFSDDTSEAYAFFALRTDQLMLLHYHKRDAA